MNTDPTYEELVAQIAKMKVDLDSEKILSKTLTGQWNTYRTIADQQKVEIRALKLEFEALKCELNR